MKVKKRRITAKRIVAKKLRGKSLVGKVVAEGGIALSVNINGKQILLGGRFTLTEIEILDFLDTRAQSK